MDIPILFEDPHLLVVNKPTGLVVHSDGRTAEPTVTQWIGVRYPALREVGEPLVLANGSVIDRPGVVHRLDRETSGALLLAKDQETFLWLKHQFQSRSIKKIYNAFVYGSLKETEGVIDRPIGKSRSDFRRFSAQRGARGELREAVTVYRSLRTNGAYSYLEIEPKTGRTHQIRVHFKAIHHPVVCDKLYAPNLPCSLGFTRTALHARKLSFTTIDRTPIEIEAPLPSDFELALNLLEKP